MASQQDPTTFDDLPSEVLWDILIRVPAKPLARMRSVSKPWNHLLSQHSFMKFHLHRSLSNDNNDETLLVFTKGYPGDPFSVTAHSSRSPDLQLANFIKLPHATYVKFLGCVHGLICYNIIAYSVKRGIKYRRLEIRIWNPTLSKTLTLRPCHKYFNKFVPTIMCYRFGFDPKTEDYKLVRLLFRLRKEHTKDWLHVEVYSMQKDSWEVIINHGLPSHVTNIFDGDTVCADGHDGRLHWLCRVNKTRCKPEAVIAFDLNVNTFSEITLPDIGVKDDDKPKPWNGIGVLHGKLCVMSCVEGCEIEVWVMNEYGVTESWAKHHVLSQFSSTGYRIEDPLGFTLNNEFLFTTLKDGLVLYDPIASTVKPFNIKPRRRRDVHVVRYVESLVWVAPTKHRINRRRISLLQKV